MIPALPKKEIIFKARPGAEVISTPTSVMSGVEEAITLPILIMSSGVEEPATLPPLQRVRSPAPKTEKPEKPAPQTNESSQMVRLAVVDLFAGVRTVHLAAKLAKLMSSPT